MKFELVKTKFKDAYLIKYFRANDNRGALIKDFNSIEFEQLLGYKFNLVENFYTISKKGVIRAIHFQDIKPQNKIIRVVKGKIYDVIVDLRPDSETFMEWEGWYLSENENIELYVPKGFGHGYLVIEDSIVSYKTDENFYAQYDTGISWNDTDLNIKWPLDQVENEVIISDKDKSLQSFKTWKLQQ